MNNIIRKIVVCILNIFVKTKYKNVQNIYRFAYQSELDYLVRYIICKDKNYILENIYDKFFMNSLASPDGNSDRYWYLILSINNFLNIKQIMWLSAKIQEINNHFGWAINDFPFSGKVYLLKSWKKGECKELESILSKFSLFMF